jgi:hypothetical protein
MEFSFAHVFLKLVDFFFNTMILVQHQDARIKPKTKENLEFPMILSLKRNLVENPNIQIGNTMRLQPWFM